MQNVNSVKIDQYTFEEIISPIEIDERLQAIALELQEDYGPEKCPIFIGILNGAFMVMADLVRAYNNPCEVNFVQISSYAGMKSTGNLHYLLNLKSDIKNRDVIIVEDIVDTGRTLNFFIKDVLKEEPKSVQLVTLLYKPEALEHDVKIDKVGFTIANEFVVGYGLDYDGLGRELSGIYKLVDQK